MADHPQDDEGSRTSARTGVRRRDDLARPPVRTRLRRDGRSSLGAAGSNLSVNLHQQSGSAGMSGDSGSGSTSAAAGTGVDSPSDPGGASSGIEGVTSSGSDFVVTSARHRNSSWSNLATRAESPSTRHTTSTGGTRPRSRSNDSFTDRIGHQLDQSNLSDQLNHSEQLNRSAESGDGSLSATALAAAAAFAREHAIGEKERRRSGTKLGGGGGGGVLWLIFSDV